MISNKYILLSSGRSGTGFICSTINSYFNLSYSSEKELFGSNHTQMAEIKDPVKKMETYYHDLIKKNGNLLS